MKRFVCLSFLLYLIVSADGCQQQKVQGCIRKYVKELGDRPDDNSHCQRLVDVFKCFWSDFHCSGPMINRWRVWVLTVATLEKFLDSCQAQVDGLRLHEKYQMLPDDLKKLLRYYNIMQNAEIATGDQKCAKEVHYRCNKKFVDAVKSKKPICGEGGLWLKCYKDNNCDKKSLIYRYAAFAGKMTVKLVNDCRKKP